MSSIRKELNELAFKIGAPVVGENISEQIAAINKYLGGTSHGANIAERIRNMAPVFGNAGGGVNEVFLGFYQPRYPGVDDHFVGFAEMIED